MIKKRLIGLLSHAKKYIFEIVFWQWVALISQVTAVVTIAEIIEKAVQQELTWNVIILRGSLLLLVIGVRFLCEKMGARASYYACVDVKRILREKIYEKLLRLGIAYREKVATSEIVQICGEGVEQLETYFGKYLPQLFYSLLAPFTLFLILSQVSLKASLVLLVCVFFIPLSIVTVQKIAKKLLSRYWGMYTELGDSFLENLQGLTTLKIYQADDKKAQEMDEEAQKFRKITMKVLTMQLNSTSVMDIAAYGGAAVGMITGLTEFLNGKIPFAGCLCIILLASEFFLPLRLLGSFFHIAMNGMAASDKIFSILDLEEPEKGTKKLSGKTFDYEFLDVHFSYNEREILKGIDLKLHAPSFYSLVGESGCGKSTIVSLMTKRKTGYDGTIKLGGEELKEIDEKEFMKHVVTVRHNSYLFCGTVEENLKMGKENATRKEMEDALEKVNLLSFLKTKQGLQTKVLENAGNLSGGQRQRLALARAFLMDAPVYIFDEATSNIDVESEEIIMSLIHEIAKTKTVLLISHRLANVVQSDQICYLENGKIKEKGTQEELIKKNGSYKALYDRQMRLENYGK